MNRNPYYLSQITDRPQSTLPDEIYLIIFNNIKLLHPVRWRQILANLTLVCWHFCHIIQPQVFRALMFTDRSGLEGKPSYLNGLSFPEAIVHGLHSATRLVEHVTEISLKKFAWDTIESLAICGKAMSLMPNLHTISLTTVTINAQLLSDICELTGLRRLSLQLCTFHKDITSDFIWALPNLKLRHCHITDLHMGSRISIKVLSHIIDPSCLESFHSSSWEISAPVLGKLQGDESRLCHLSLHKTTYDTRLLGILQQCPQLKTLRINRIISKSPGRCLSSLPKTSIPDLEAIMCPPTIISDLVPGRPLNKIDLSGVHYASVLPGASSLDIVTSLLPLGTSGINTLFQSSAQVRSLCVPVEIFLAESFGKHFPLLEELAIEFYHPNYTKIGRFVSMDAIEKVWGCIINL